MIPCVVEKCILFPVCKSKRTIHCDVLLKHMKLLHKTMYGELKSLPLRRLGYEQIESAHVNIWEFINKYLPKVLGIHPESNNSLDTYVIQHSKGYNHD